MAKYTYIAEEIEQKIISGEYQPGKVLPDQKFLAEEYQTTRVTIQKAIKLLKHKGLIYSKQGSGMYVKKNALLSEHAMLGAAIRGTTKRLSPSQTMETKVITFQVRFPTDNEAEHLMITKEQPIYETIRLRIVDGEPFKLEHSLFPVDLISNVTKEILEKSLYKYILHELKLMPSGANRIIRAAKATKLDQEYLAAKKNDPILEVEQIVYLENGTPFEYSFSRNRYDKSEFVFNTDSSGD